MAEVLAAFSHTVVDENRNRYRVQASGAPMPDGTWHGWIEFIPIGGGPPIRSGRETTQPNRTDAVYWATGLTPVYLEGALERARRPLVVHDTAPSTPAFDEPAAVTHVVEAAPTQEAVLNPFSVYEKGEALLRRQLAALSAWHLVNIVTAYRLSDKPEQALSRLPASALIELIVSAMTASGVGTK
jgi:hypothetical protein